MSLTNKDFLDRGKMILSWSNKNFKPNKKTHCTIYFTNIFISCHFYSPISSYLAIIYNLSIYLFYLKLKTELVPVSESLTSIFKLAKGVPKGTFSGIDTLYSGWLNLGASSFTSLGVSRLHYRGYVNISYCLNSCKFWCYDIILYVFNSNGFY